MKLNEKVSLVSLWHNGGSNVSTVEKKTLNIYHVLEYINYGILRIYTEFWKKIKKVLVACQKIPKISRLRHLENHTEALDLYLMNRHLNMLIVEWISVVSLSVIPGIIDLLGELSHVMKTGSVIATLSLPNSGLVPVNLPKSSIKKLFGPKVMLCPVEF